jgi:hypothetical protein
MKPNGRRPKVMDDIIRLFINPYTRHKYADTPERVSYERITDEFFNARSRTLLSAEIKHTARFPGREIITGNRFVKTTRVELERGTKILFALDKSKKTCIIELEDGRLFLLKDREWELFRDKLTKIGGADFKDDPRRIRHRNKLREC